MPGTKGETAATGSGPLAAPSGAPDPANAEGFLAAAKLKKTGSLVMTVPAAAQNMLGLAEGQEMVASVKGAQIVAEPIPTPEKAISQLKYTLDELVAGYKADGAFTEDERAWMDAPPAGREVC